MAYRGKFRKGRSKSAKKVIRKRNCTIVVIPKKRSKKRWY